MRVIVHAVSPWIYHYYWPLDTGSPFNFVYQHAVGFLLDQHQWEYTSCLKMNLDDKFLLMAFLVAVVVSGVESLLRCS